MNSILPLLTDIIQHAWERPLHTGHAPAVLLPIPQGTLSGFNFAEEFRNQTPSAANGSDLRIGAIADETRRTASGLQPTPLALARIHFVLAPIALALAATNFILELTNLALARIPFTLEDTKLALAGTALRSKGTNFASHPFACRPEGIAASVGYSALALANTPFVPEGSLRTADGSPSAAQASAHPIKTFQMLLISN